MLVFTVFSLIPLVFAYIKYYNIIVGKKVFLCGKNKKIWKIVFAILTAVAALSFMY